ncbi:uncharacterized protein LOC112565638 isoform X2 [Pomacea canaliculata]|uniref:uncharacterized protein LOC112565638 isoform X2 n=1 Tax=Pomacea canaliculata TaxID=400727 RepID=UPI000D731925|nr:uncharacterized protein LOC112565638 isoform X2 [Pomacea canaliculata]
MMMESLRTFWGCEFLSPGKSCLELLTDFYIDLTQQKNHYMHHCTNMSAATVMVVGLNKTYLLNVDEVLEDLMDLIFLVLSSGGNSNVGNENHMTPLHRVCMYSHDSRLLHLLHENGADINAVDAEGSTPLLALCDSTTHQLYDISNDILPAVHEHSSTSGFLKIKVDFLDYLLQIKDLDIDHQNSHGHTALFHCMLRGDSSGTLMLLHHGADPTLRGTVWETRKRKREISPLLAVFLSAPVKSKLGTMNANRCFALGLSTISHLVDAGYFNRLEIEEEIEQLLEQDLQEFFHMKLHAGLLIQQMFGGVSCSLQQLAARQLFGYYLLENTRYLQHILPVSTFQQRFQTHDLQNLDGYEEYVGLVLNNTVLQAFVSLLGLPVDTLLHMQIELLLQRLGLLLARLHVARPGYLSPTSSCDFWSSESSGSVSQDEGDSDLEYW